MLHIHPIKYKFNGIYSRELCCFKYICLDILKNEALAFILPIGNLVNSRTGKNKWLMFMLHSGVGTSHLSCLGLPEPPIGE